MEKGIVSLKESDMLALAEYQKTLWNAPRLELLFFELTDSCNLNCRHCGSRCSASKRTFLDTGIIKRVISSVAEKYEPNGIMIALTGGEPLLHPDCTEIIGYAHSRGFKVGITSNGTLIDDRMACEMKKSGLDTISISIDGIGESHDGLRMIRGSFEKAVKCICVLKEVGIEPQLTTVVHSKNLDELDRVYEFIKNNDIYSWRLTNVEPIGRALDDSDMLLDRDELIRMFDYIKTKRFDSGTDIEVTYGCAHFAGYEYEHIIRGFYFQCIAGTKVASVMANGDIGACLDIERRESLVQGNVYRDDFLDVWENRFEVFRQDRSELSSMCKECCYKKVCMGDSAHTWNFDKNEPLYCTKVLEMCK